jgi:hypothetical protein
LTRFDLFNTQPPAFLGWNRGGLSRALRLLGTEFAALVLLLTMTVAVAARETQDWAKADLATTRLPPSAFSELPDPIQKDLTRRGCTIPQPFTGTCQNVIRGRFTSATRTD